MERQKLPNETAIIVLSIFGIVCCWCLGLGLIPSVIALVLALKAEKLYRENPEMYVNSSTIKTGKILAIIGIVLGLYSIGSVIYQISTVGWEVMMEQSREMMEQYGIDE
ncbi:CCC motif membrane protein [Pricia sp.]|uniref:CCC motif membrane protein n=1 Tax=Pricia sp. TaxID=2268138 RepID=UPI0035932973